MTTLTQPLGSNDANCVHCGRPPDQHHPITKDCPPPPPTPEQIAAFQKQQDEEFAAAYNPYRDALAKRLSTGELDPVTGQPQIRIDGFALLVQSNLVDYRCQILCEMLQRMGMPAYAVMHRELIDKLKKETARLA